MTLGELARRLECPVEGDSGIEIHRVAKIESAGPGDVTFFAASKYAAALAATKASAVIAGADAAGAPCAVIRSASPYLTFAKALQVLSPERKPEPGVHKLAAIAADAVVDPSATVGAFAVIERGARVGARTVVHPHVVIGAESMIGPDCVLHAHVSIRERCVLGARVVVQNGAVIGSDGYGFAPRPDGSYEKIPQVGPVVIEDDVEIGANTTIDRPAIGETRIKSGVKIDNLVQIAHGVVVGRNSLLAAQVGIAGTTIIGDNVMFGGQSGASGHLTIGDRVKVAAKTGIIASIDAGVSMSGHPMMETSEWRRAHVVVRKLPEMRKQLKSLEERLAALEEKTK
ncbi:MAG: UDP-3-O-(3-hydroxymyristoyl)glucosamine N-acyltransferase [Acidobacteriota bacterium]|nr:UDP-3-O-(3-hydroxymyristoyl)glucosamine N-acyltransferase [Acidobacteriota bacterium]